MARAKYPIKHAPSAAFMERLKVAAGLTWTVTGLEFVQHGAKVWMAVFMLSHYINARPQQVELGPRESMFAMENRLIEFLTA